jgi:NADH:ubiquinone oxidoreductase subunit E
MSDMVEMSVCIGSSCHLNGSYNVIQSFQQLIEEYSLHEKLEFKAYFCMKQCQNKGVSVTLDGVNYRVDPESARQFFKETVLMKINFA